jgi:pilus assembly protein TadC
MTLEMLNQNIAREKETAIEINFLFQKLETEDSIEKKNAIIQSINALLPQLKMLNRALPALIEGVSVYKTLNSSEKQNKTITNIQFTQDNQKKSLALKKGDEKSFMQQLFKHKEAKAKLKESSSGSESSNLQVLESFSRISNRYFGGLADKLIKEGYFNSVKSDLRKIASPLIINSFVVIMLFCTLLAFIVSVPIAIVLILFKSYLLGGLVMFLIPLIVFAGFYLYPSSTRKGLEKEINQELPFLTIYIAAISTSGIEPSKIFNILVNSKDYPYSQREIKKLTNYLNFYGYDLVSALRKSSETSPSERLAQLFDGLATAITSGGELSSYLNKHADSLLFDYRLEREKYTHVAETFMNIYISLVIAAPMIMMMLFVLISLTGFSSGGILSPSNLSFLVIFVISLINMMFLLFLNVKQPKF